MKKVAMLAGLISLAMVFSGTAQAAPTGRFFFGGFTETVHYLSYQGIGFGGEIGYSVSDIISLVAEVATGKSSLSYKSTSSYYSSQETMALTMTPLCFSVHFTAPLGDRVQPYVGVGIAYNSVTITDSSTDNYSYNQESSTQTEKLHAFAPVFKIGLAVSLTGNIKIVGEYQQTVAKDKITSSSSYGSSEQEVFLGTSNFRFGIRIVI